MPSTNGAMLSVPVVEGRCRYAGMLAANIRPREVSAQSEVLDPKPTLIPSRVDDRAGYELDIRIYRGVAHCHTG